MNKSKQFWWIVLLYVGMAGIVVLLFVVKSRHDREKFALFNAAGEGDLEQVKLLVSQGSPINRQFPMTFGWTPLMNAIFHKNIKVAQYLVEAGADVNLSDNSGKTALMWATGSDEYAPLVKDLIAHGAKIDAKDKYGTTALQLAQSENPQTPALIEVMEAAKSAQEAKSHKPVGDH